MRVVLQVLSLGFAVAVLAALTTNAARDGSGCDSAKSQAPAPAATTKPAVAPAPTANAPAPPPPTESNRFMGATKAAPVFLPPPSQPQPQAAQPQTSPPPGN